MQDIVISNEPTTLVILYSENRGYSEEKFYESLKSVVSQKYVSISNIMLLEISEKMTPATLRINLLPETKIPQEKFLFPSVSKALKAIAEKIKDGYLLLLDIREAPVFLKYTAVLTFVLTLQRDKNVGMVYADYTLLSKEGNKEVHLLDYHVGRIRDNMDVGRVYAFPMAAFKSIVLDETLKYAQMYDIRLKISEKYSLKCIANRYEGSLYEVESIAKSHNVFDYLQAAKESQKEMELVFTNHLKRIDAYLAPGQYEGKPSFPHEGTILVSILIPVHRRPEFIGMALESVFSQTIKSRIEVIVIVNGGENDPTADEVRKYLPGGSLYRSENPCVHLLVTDINNIGLCLNMGLKKACGKYYLQLDSDDRLKSFAAEKVLECFEKNPDAAMVVGSYEVWEKKSDHSLVRREDIPVVKHEEWTEENGRNNLLRINGAGAPRAYNIRVVQELGWFAMNDDPYARNYGEDYDMVLRISEKYKIARIWEPIYEVVRHAGGTDHSIDQNTIDRNDNAKDWMRLLTIKRRQKINSKKS